MPAPRRGELIRLFGEELRAAKDDLGRLVSRLKRSDRPDLKYRIVHSTTYKNAAGVPYGCAIAFR